MKLLTRKTQTNAARQEFWNSDLSANSHLVQFTADDCQDLELWRLTEIGHNLHINESAVDGMQVRFWRLCSGIYRRYRQVLAESHQTDFDQLMLDLEKPGFFSKLLPR